MATQEELPNNKNKFDNDEISAKELFFKIKSWFSFVLSKWKIILLIVFIGVGIAVTNNLLSKKIYTADCTFTLDEGSSSKASMGGLALLGIATPSEGGIFQGKNLIWLYSSRLMLEKTLLAPVDSGRKEKLFVDWFLSIDKQGKKIISEPGYKVKFSAGDEPSHLSKEQNIIMGFAIATIKNNYLKILETKNTDNFITVSIKATDELFAKQFCERIVATVNDFYIDTKTKKMRTEIEMLQNKTDKFKTAMTSSMYKTASATDNTPYPNLTRQILQVAPQKSGVDVQVSSALYIEMARNLEANKMNLAKETPLIQVIEEPILPLPSSVTPVYLAAVYGAFIAGFIAILMLTVYRMYKLILS